MMGGAIDTGYRAVGGEIEYCVGYRHGVHATRRSA